LNLQFTSC